MKNATSFKRKHKPPPASRSGHNATMMTALQAERLRTGRRESSPSEYRGFRSKEDAELHRVRERLEDLRMCRDLGIDPKEILP